MAEAFTPRIAKRDNPSVCLRLTKRKPGGSSSPRIRPTEQPYLNVSMAKVYLSAQSPEFLTRTWSAVLEHLAQSYEGATAVRWRKFAKSAPLKLLVNLPLYQTEAVHFLAVLNHQKAGVSTNVWLRILHNRALDLGWLLTPVLNRRLWPKVKYKARRAITADEHAKVIASEKMDDYRKFFRLLWETGGSQTDIAYLNAEDIDWTNNRLYYARKKLANRGGGRAALAMGAGLKAILKELPSAGPLFPRLRSLSEDERASHFRKVCLRVGMAGGDVAQLPLQLGGAGMLGRNAGTRSPGSSGPRKSSHPSCLRAQRRSCDPALGSLRAG